MFGRNKRRDAITQGNADAYVALRELALTADPGESGLEPRAGSGVYGGLMDLGHPSGTVTVLGLADGTASLYTTSGGGVIGGGEHPTVQAAVAAWLTALEAAMGDLRPMSEFRLPGVGEVGFVALSTRGHRGGSGNEVRLQARKTALSPLYIAGQGIVTQLRLLEPQEAQLT